MSNSEYTSETRAGEPLVTEIIVFRPEMAKPGIPSKEPTRRDEPIVPLLPVPEPRPQPVTIPFPRPVTMPSQPTEVPYRVPEPALPTR